MLRSKSRTCVSMRVGWASKVGVCVTAVTAGRGVVSSPMRMRKVLNAVPKKWDGPSLNVTSDAMATETLVLAHEGLEIVEDKQEG